MKIVTILKQVPDAESRVRLKDGMIDLAGVTCVIDGMDEYGVEQALRLRESGVEAEVVALGYGARDSEQALRTALAMGADRAVLLEGETVMDPLSLAFLLAGVVEEEAAELVLVGGKQADWDSAALGPAVAEVLGWPHVDWTTAFSLEGDRFEAVHDTDRGNETLAGRLPVVITTQQGLNEPRYPTLPNIMKAKRKPFEVRTVATPEGQVATRGYTAVERERRRELLEGEPTEVAAELVRRLRDEAKVL